jgi:hypothetical protein
MWTHRSPRRKEEWKARENVTRQISDDVDNRWNYTKQMIEVAEDYKAALNDQVNNHPELKPLRLTKEHWKQLSNIKAVLAPFDRYTEQTSKKLASIHLSIRMYFEINEMFTKILKKEGEYATFDQEIIKACKKGFEKFKKYWTYMMHQDIYFVASVLDPRIKTRWLRKYFEAEKVERIVGRVRTFLKALYKNEPELPAPKALNNHKSLEYSYLEEFETIADDSDENDIDRYLDSLPIKFVLNEKEDQIQ